MSKLNKCICGNCKYYDPDEYYCMTSGEHYKDEQDTCENWEDDNEPTEEEQRINAGDNEAHRIMEEGREI